MTHLQASTDRTSHRDRQVPRTSRQWCEYFRDNAAALLDVPWHLGAQATQAQIRAIADSVREFQLGESAEGRHFVQVATAYAARSGDCDYVAAVRMLIAEEQRHARDLGRWLQLAGIPLARRTAADSAFRFLRKCAGLEVCVAVLLTAEIIARVYYRALRNATDCPVLRRVCAQILRDEVRHVRFQAGQLGLLRRQRARWAVRLSAVTHRLMLRVACLIVWRKHARALRAGGYGFCRFWRATGDALQSALAAMSAATIDSIDAMPHPTANRVHAPD